MERAVQGLDTTMTLALQIAGKRSDSDSDDSDDEEEEKFSDDQVPQLHRGGSLLISALSEVTELKKNMQKQLKRVKKATAAISNVMDSAESATATLFAMPEFALSVLLALFLGYTVIGWFEKIFGG